MLILLAVFGGVTVAAGLMVVPVLVLASHTNHEEEEAHERWIAGLRAVAAAQAADTHPAAAERLPFEDEYDAPARARDWARREYDQLTAQFPWMKDTQS